MQEQARDPSKNAHPAEPGLLTILEQNLTELRPMLPNDATEKEREMRRWILTKHVQCAAPAIAVFGGSIWLAINASMLPAALLGAAVCLGWWNALRYFALPLVPANRGMFAPVEDSEMDELAAIAQREPAVAAALSRWKKHAARPTYQFYQIARVLDEARALENTHSST
jgi:hypothetical protein